MKLIIFLGLLLTTNVQGGKKFVSLGDSSEKLTIDLLKNLIENNTENQLISPISMQTILGLLQTGSSGKSQEELAKILHLPKKASLVKEAFKNNLQLNNSKIDLTSANNIYVAENFQIPKQLQNSAKIFHSQVHKINPKKREETVKEINAWVENQTKHKIKNIVNNEIIQENTVMVLINALYFNAPWKIPFDADITHKRNFHVEENRQIKTDMMLQSDYFNYTNSKSINAKILELPYEDEDYVMNVILPNEKQGLNNLLKKINKVFRELDTLNDEEEVSVMLPKFKFEYKIELNDVLKKMGLVSIFDQLEFKGQAKMNNLKVSKIMQKTFIDVNEKGSEAAAATAIGIEDRMGNYDKIFFTADHPFLFIIRNKISRVVLFVGTYKNPEI